MAAISPVPLKVDLLLRWRESQKETDRLFDILKPSALYDRPIAERHRVVFYVGHLEAFDWNLFSAYLNLDRFSSGFDRLFAFGIDPVDGGFPTDIPSDWPSITEVMNYRRRVREELNAALANAADTEELIYLMNLAVEHRYMHAETLEYMFHQLPFESKVAPEAEKASSAYRVTKEEVLIPEGRVTLGLDRNGGKFGWDNEFEAHVVEVPAFRIDKHKVTNGDFLAFVKAGCYQIRELWSDDDWGWRGEAQIKHPAFWVPTNGEFLYKHMFEQTPLPMNSPVFVSHAEANAYARWAGKELPTEAEWQRAALGAKSPAETRMWWDPPEVGSSPEFSSDFAVEDLIGTGWEWTSTPFAPFPGFTIMAAYPGYSANFFDGKHFVLKGGSPRTAASMLRPTFRNWFQAHYQYVYAGFRCVNH